MDWIAPTIGVLGVVGGTLLGHWLARRSAQEQWDRDVELRKAEWRREDTRRWDKERLDVYSQLIEECLSYIDKGIRFSQEWDRAPGARDGLLSEEFRIQAHKVAKVRSRAWIIASAEVRPALKALTDVVDTAGEKLYADHSDGPESRDQFVEQFIQHMGGALADFSKATGEELIDTVDPLADHRRESSEPGG